MGSVAILGIGLIGGSYGLAMRKRGLADHIVGCARSRRTLEAALRLGAADEVTSDPREACRQAELVILAPPPAAVATLAHAAADAAPCDAVVTDAASVKHAIVTALDPVFGSPSRFVGGHPMAGSERAGVENASADLFVGAPYLLTPTPNTSRSALARVREIAIELGARVMELDPQEHDREIALVSHVPHLAAAAVARVACVSDRAPDIHGAGLADTTRVAEGDPDLWTDILMSNGEAVAAGIDSLCSELDTLRRLLGMRDIAATRVWLAGAADMRRRIRLLAGDAGHGEAYERTTETDA